MVTDAGPHRFARLEHDNGNEDACAQFKGPADPCGLCSLASGLSTRNPLATRSVQSRAVALLGNAMNRRLGSSFAAACADRSAAVGEWLILLSSSRSYRAMYREPRCRCLHTRRVVGGIG